MGTIIYAEDFTRSTFIEHPVLIDCHIVDDDGGECDYRPPRESESKDTALSFLQKCLCTTRTGHQLLGYIDAPFPPDEVEISRKPASLVYFPDLWVSENERIHIWCGRVDQFGKESMFEYAEALSKFCNATLEEIFPVIITADHPSFLRDVNIQINGFGYLKSEHEIGQYPE